MSRRWAAALALGSLLAPILACGGSGSYEEDTRRLEEERAQLTLAFAPMHEGLRVAVSQLPPAGSVDSTMLETVDPAIDFGTVREPGNAAIVPLSTLLDGSSAGEEEFNLADSGDVYVSLSRCLSDTRQRGDPFVTHSSIAACRRVADTTYVVAVRSTRYVPGSVNEAVDEFDYGVVDVEGFVIRLPEGRIVGRVHTSATNGDDIDFRYQPSRAINRRNAAIQALETDLRRQVREAIREELAPSPSAS